MPRNIVAALDVALHLFFDNLQAGLRILMPRQGRRFRGNVAALSRSNGIGLAFRRKRLLA